MSVKGLYPTVFAEYPLGRGLAVSLLDGNAITSDVFNTRDLGSSGEIDFPFLGPGSQAWIIEYSFQIQFPVLVPTDTLGLTMTLSVGFQEVAPFVLGPLQQIILPVFVASLVSYQGWARISAPVASWTLNNATGANLVVSFQFWGRAA